MKKIMSIMVLAMAFTFSCSDDKEESKEFVFCNMTDSDVGLRMCTEITVGGGFSKSELEIGGCTRKGGDLADKCENTEFKCPASKDGIEMIVYLYEYPEEIKTCADFDNFKENR